MGKKLAVWVVCLAVLCLLGTFASDAQSQVRILVDRSSAHFADKLTFQLVAEHESLINGVTLYYRRQKESVTSRVVPEFTPGRHVEATFEKTLERGEIPPGTILEYYWRLDLANGSRFDTDVRTFAYEDDRFPWQSLQTDNVSILYYGDERSQALAQDLLKRGQSTLSRLQDEVGVKLEMPVHVYVYQNIQDMSLALSPRSQGFDEQIVTLGVAVADDTLLLLGDHSQVRDTLAHELSHIVVGLATKNPYSPVPRWLDEGLAMYTEGELPANNARALREGIARDNLISVRSLSGYTGDPSQVDLYYGEVYSLVDFMLRTFGRDKMSELLQVFKEGTYQEDALQQVYGLASDALDARWRESLGLQPRPTAAPVATAVPRTNTAKRGEPCAVPSLVGVLGLVAALGLRRVGLR